MALLMGVTTKGRPNSLTYERGTEEVSCSNYSSAIAHEFDFYYQLTA